jgi:SAM-dependent methyltransferase
MHPSIRKELRRFYRKNKEFIDSARVAELGALNINGSPRDYLPSKLWVGFDIVNGSGIDVKIEPGIIPQEHKGIYDLVVSSSSFHYCPQPELYKRQIFDLLKPNGVLWISMCSPQCKRHHTTSKNEYGYTDCFRMTRKELCRFLRPELVDEKCYLVGDSHHQDIIYIGKKTA